MFHKQHEEKHHNCLGRCRWNILSSLPSHLLLPQRHYSFLITEIRTWQTWAEKEWPSDQVQFCFQIFGGHSASVPHTCGGTSWSGRCCSCCSPVAPRRRTPLSLVSENNTKTCAINLRLDFCIEAVQRCQTAPGDVISSIMLL